MNVSQEEIQRIARLSMLHVDDTSLEALTKQIEDILRYVSQLEAVPHQDGDEFRPGPTHAPLREDRVTAEQISLSPEQMAPSFEQGLYVVPKVEGVGEDQ